MSDPIARNFMRFWLGGLGLLAVMAVMNIFLSNDTVQWGIIDHQMAGTAARVNIIQQSWRQDGTLNLARISMAIDLLFIAVYSWGAYNGGKAMRRAKQPVVRRLGGLIMVAAILYPFLDYTETICQFIQAVNFSGDDTLAHIAATVRPIKSVDFLITLLGLITALSIRRMTKT